VFEKAKNDDWHVLLTPTKPVPKDWFCEIKNAEILGLACGGGQQMPIFAALGAKCTVLDYSEMKDEQLYRESIKNNWGIQFSHTIEEQLEGNCGQDLFLRIYIRTQMVLAGFTNSMSRLIMQQGQLKYKKQLERRYET